MDLSSAGTDTDFAANNQDWSEIQTALDTRYQATQNMATCLQTLYHWQCDTGFISPEIKAYLNETHTIPIPQGHIKIQLNPSRQNRGISPIPNPSPRHLIPYRGGVPCFCCLDNIRIQWPTERGWQLPNLPLIALPNPSPIFPTHFTLVTPDHIPQVMRGSWCAQLAETLPGFWVIQNGPNAGATNPWHLHLQVFEAVLPIETMPIIQESDQVYSTAIPFVFKLIGPATPHFYTWLDRIIEHFHAANPHHRMNILVKSIDKMIHVVIALRHTDHKTTLYTTGQPGYAEIGGFITPATHDRFSNWCTRGAALYDQLMSDISPPEESITIFRHLAFGN